MRHNIPQKLSAIKPRLNYNAFARELAEAQYALGLLEGSQKKLHSEIINPNLLVSPLTAKEAAVSSKIEGTQSTVSDVFLFEAGGHTKYSDIAQVTNYRNAINFAVSEIKKGKSLTPHLVKSLHHLLLSGVRHRGTLGDFRKNQVWIAEKVTDPIEKAIYIPPEHIIVPEYIDDLFEYLKNGDENGLVKAGIAHYQFEAIHPFDDGNGRIGRLIIPLILFSEKLLSSPILYISGYFEDHREEYLTELHKVDETNKFEDWLKFFLHSTAQQLRVTQDMIEKIYALYSETKGKFSSIKSPYISKFIDFIFRFPIFSVSQARKNLGGTRVTIASLVKKFMEEKILVEVPGPNKKIKLYQFNPLIEIIK